MASAARLYETAVWKKARGWSLGLNQSRCFASPSSAVPLGTPTGVLQSLKGVGDGPNFSPMAGQKTVGVSQGGEDPLAAFFAYFLSHHRK